MNAKEAFKIGFLQKCAEDHLTPEETMRRIEHTRFMLKSAYQPGRASVEAMRTLWGALAPIALIAPPALGLGAGYGLAKMQDDTFDKGEPRKREEISEYQRAVERLKQLRTRQQTELGAG